MAAGLANELQTIPFGDQKPAAVARGHRFRTRARSIGQPPSEWNIERSWRA